jgi:hypothetical protein
MAEDDHQSAPVPTPAKGKGKKKKASKKSTNKKAAGAAKFGPIGYPHRV